MKRTKITLKNYRAFTDATPVSIEIGQGLAALVGTNNSGKSTLLKFLFELRGLFDYLGAEWVDSAHSLPTVFQDKRALNIEHAGVQDPLEIFNNSNDRDLIVEIEIFNAEKNSSSADSLSRMTLRCDRNNPTTWRFQCFGQQDPKINLATIDRGIEINIGEKLILVSQVEKPIWLDCSDFWTTIRFLRDARYFGPFRNAINQGSGQNFDLFIGTSFVDLWNEWKTGGNITRAMAIEKVTEDIRILFGFERLEINASTIRHTLTVQIDGKPYNLSELGSGLAQFIIVFGNAAIAGPSLLLIDEPETNLHPSLQIDFLLSLASYARDGVVYSTHSIGLARSVADRIYSIQRNGTRRIVRPLENTPNYVEFIGELSFSTFRDFGAETLLLVEGVTEVKVIQQLLRLVRLEHKVVLLPMGGDQMVIGGRDAELSELKRISSRIFALVDSEKSQAGDPPAQRRQAFLQTCELLGIIAHALERRAIENYFPQRAIIAAFGKGYTALQPYERLQDCSKPWAKHDNWKIARQMTLDEIDGTDIGKFLRRLEMIDNE